MKKITVIILIIIVLVFLYAIRDKFMAEKINTPTESENGIFHPDPSNATFIFDDGPVTFSSGKNERPVAPGSTFTEETIILDKLAYGDVNTDGKQDTAVLLARYGAGSGTFIYVAVFVSGPVAYKGSNTIFIGDRITPQSISIDGDTVVVNYLDRGPSEALAAEPTIKTSKQLVYKSGKFLEK